MRSRIVPICRIVVASTLLALLLPSPVSAAERGDVLVVGASESQQILGPELRFLMDDSSSLTIEDVSGPKMADRFEMCERPETDLHPDGRTIWFRIALRSKDEATRAQEWILATLNPLVGEAELYTPAEADEEGADEWSVLHLGTDTSHRNPAWLTGFRVDPSADHVQHVYLRVRTFWPVTCTFSIMSGAYYETAQSHMVFWSGMLIGVLVMIALTSLLAFLYLRENSNLWYVGFVGFSAIYFMGFRGALFGFLVTLHPMAWPVFHLAMISLMTFTSAGFTRNFLQTKDRSRHVDKVVLAYGALSLLGLPMCFTGSPQLMTNYSVVLGILAPIATFLPGVVRLRQGFRPAGFYLAAWGVFSFAGFLFALPVLLEAFGLSDQFLWYNGWLIFQVGAALNAILLSLGMVARVRRLRLDRDKISRARESAEAALSESEAKYRAIFHNAQVALFRIADDGRVLDANMTMARTLGYDDLDELLSGYNLNDSWVDPIARERLADLLSKNGKVERFEAQFYGKDRQPRWVRFSSTLFPERGYQDGVGIGIDDEKAARAALADSERMFQTLTESMSAMVLMYELDLQLVDRADCETMPQRVVYANKAVEDITGYSPEELMGTDALSTLRLDEDSKERMRVLRDEALKGNVKNMSLELKITTKNGDHRWIESTGAIFQTANGPAKVIVAMDITEKKKAQEALALSERKFRTLADTTSAHISIGAEGRFLYANNAVLEYYDMSWEELSKKDPHEVLAEQAHAAGHAAFDKAMAEGRDDVRFEYCEDRPNGERRWFQVNGTIIEFEGEPAWLWTSFDVTDHKLAKRQVEESERKFRALAESTTARIGITRGNRFVFANKTLLDRVGMTWEELSRTDPADTLAPDAAEVGSRAFAEAEESRRDTFSFEYREEDGSWTEMSACRIEMDGEEAWIWTSFDITAHKRVQEALRESEDRYRAIFNTSGTGMITFGDDKLITLANDEFASITGYSREEVEGKVPWTAFFRGEALQKMERYHERRTADPGSLPGSYEAELVDRRGARREGIVNINVVPGTDQRVASFLDITERKRAEAQMYQADKMAALGQIIAGVAHEINNPNNFIHFNLPILRRYIDAVRPMLEHHLEDEPGMRILNMPYDVFMEDLHKLLDNMAHGSERITGIVSELKGYIRSHENEERRPATVAHIFDHVMTLAGKQVGKMVKSMDVYVEEGLPPVTVNEGKIEQVLINLVINAGQAADKDDSWVKLSAHKGEGDTIDIIVEDNGAGIPEASLEQIFEPFYTSKGRDAGTGLGLSISQRIINEHGGDIAVASEEGVGTMFTVRLPIENTKEGKK